MTNSRKARLSITMSKLGIDRPLAELYSRYQFPFIRAINYHDVPPDRSSDFDRQVRYFLERFEIVGPRLLEKLLAGDWSSAKPGLILSFDDGLRSHAEVVAPLLETYEVQAWFMVPGAFLSTPPEAQGGFAQRHSITHRGFDYGDPRVAMTWQQLRRIGQFHEIGCHTWTHCRLRDALSDEDLKIQIPDAKRQMEHELERDIRTFAWVGGEERSYGRKAATAIQAAGFRYSFMTNNQVISSKSDRLWLQRTNIESTDGDDIVRFQLSGAMDLLYMPKRRRIARHLT